MDSQQPTTEQARAVVAYLRGDADFAHESVDWLAVARLTSYSAASEACPLPGSAPLLPFRAKAALELRRAIIDGDPPIVRDAPASLETLGAAYFILTAGQYTAECPNHRSPHGRHRWRFCVCATDRGRYQTCDFCGELRVLFVTSP